MAAAVGSFRIARTFRPASRPALAVASRSGGPEVGRAGDHDVGDLVAQGDLGVADHLAQDERRDVLGAERLPLVLEDEVGIAHVLLDPRDHAVRLDLRRLLGRVAHDDVVAVEEDDRWRDPLALLVGDDDGLSVLVNIGDRRIGRPQIDPVDALQAFSHVESSRCSSGCWATVTP